MAALLLKKKYLDPKEMIERIPKEKLGVLVSTVNNSMTANRPLLYLKRCCEILIRIYSYAVLPPHPEHPRPAGARD